MTRIKLGALLLSLLAIQACSVEKAGPADLHIVTRAEWGSVDTVINQPEQVINRITIHHGGVIFDGKKATDAYLRDLQSWSRSEKKWIDIPYHYVMDLEGRVYEARPVKYAGDTNTDYDPAGHLLICVLGNYEEQVISAQQIENLTVLLSRFSRQYKVRPDLIRGHKDYTETDCPGKDLYRFLADGSLVSAVKEKNKTTP